MPSELQALVDASLDFWLTTGRYAAEFEREFARWIGIRHAILVNSGSSANLLALTTLTADELGERRLRPGDEVITAAAGFPTTVNPIIQNRLVPVFVDSTLPTYNADPDAIEAAVGPEDPRHHDRAHPGQPVRPRPRPGRSPSGTACGSSRTPATPSAPRGEGGRWGPSATSRRSASTRRTT